jgi:hypothetical protein
MDFSVSTILSPAAIAALFWFFVRHYFEKQADILAQVSKALSDMQLKFAIHETRASQVDKVLSDFEKMKEDFVIHKSRLEAAWRLLDRLQEMDKRHESEIKELKNILAR